MGNAFEKSSTTTPFLGQLEFSGTFGSADRLLLSGFIDEAWEEYVRIYKERQDIHSEELGNLMIGLWRESYSRTTSHYDGDFVPTTAIEVFSCRKCWGIMYEPCTLSCGHTLCRKCIGKPTNFVVCFVCKEPTQFDKWPTKTNVVLAKIIRKWFPKEVEAARLRLHGNTYFCKKNYRKSIEKYTEGLNHNPKDHLLYGNRSNVYYISNEFEKALADADMACQLKPKWSKAHYRRAVAMVALKRYTEASIEFLSCILLDAANLAVRKNLEKGLHELLLQEAKSSRQARQRESQDIQQSIAELKLQRAESLPEVSDSTQGQGQGQMDIDTFVAMSREDMETSTSVEQEKFEDMKPAAKEVKNPLRIIVESFSEGPKDDECEETVEGKAARFCKEIGETRLKEVLDDMECPLCCRILYEPTTTPCGHMFCRSCLSRSLDHNTACPFCRFSLLEFVTLRKKETTDVVNHLLTYFYDGEVKERKQKAKEELENLAKVATDTNEDIPIFVCTLALPTRACPLHIFEPRYRLMLRQCIESGSQQFGMTMYDEEKGFADFGCMVEIKAVNYLNDGRALVDTIGGRRFKVLSRGVRDGYRTAKVEWIHDDLSEEGAVQTYRSLNQEVYSEAKAWFENLSGVVQTQITNSFGRFPDCCTRPEETTYGPVWTWWLLQLIIDSPATQLSYLSSESPIQRLHDIRIRLHSLS